MNHANELIISPNWPGFSRLWKTVAIVLFVLLLILWLIGASPWSKDGGVCAPVSTDSSGVVDTQPPSLALKCDPVTRIPAGSLFEDVGVTATDNTDGEPNVVVAGEVDYNTPSEYVLTYTATDKAGNIATTSRTVIVESAATIDADLPAVAKLYFDSGSAEFPADTGLSLAGVIAYLNKNKAATAVISGFHSADGSREFNQELAKQRAQSVRRLLQDSGVELDRIVLEKPVETTGSGPSEEARRVEVSVRQ